MPQTEEQTAIQRTYGRGFFRRFERRSRPSPLPRWKAPGDVPAERLSRDDRGRLPYGLGDMRHQERPGSHGQRRRGGRSAGLLGVLPGVSAPFLPPPLWHPGDQEPRRAPRCGAHAESVLSPVALDRGQASDQRTRGQRPSNRVRDRRLRRAATETIRAGGDQVSPGLDGKRPASPAQHAALLCSCHDGLDLWVLWQVPRRQGARLPSTPFSVPYGLPCGTRFCRPPARAGQAVWQACRQATARPVHSIPRGTGGQEPGSTDWGEGWSCCQGLPAHVRKKDQRPVLPAVMQGCRRPRELLAPWCHLRGPWRARRFGLLPGSAGNAGQKHLPRHCGSAWDTARPTGGGCEVVGSTAVC
jgi:hypothetical protein